MTTTYRVRDFSDHEMQNELASSREIQDWSKAWDRLHHHKAPAPEGTALTVIEKTSKDGWQVCERNYAGGGRPA